MTVDAKGPYSSIHAGQTFWFCSAGCKAKFDQEPARYAAAPAGGKDHVESRP